MAFAERRGVWTYVILAGRDGFGVNCLTDTDFHEGSIGTAGAPTDYRPPSSREVLLGNCCRGGGTIRHGVKNFIGEVDGYAGPEVARIVVNTPARGPVEATVLHRQLATRGTGPGVMGRKLYWGQMHSIAVDAEAGRPQARLW